MAIVLHHPLINSHPAGRHAPGTPAALLGYVARLIRDWREREAELREIEAMTERDLRDIGVTRLTLRQAFDRPHRRG